MPPPGGARTVMYTRGLDASTPRPVTCIRTFAWCVVATVTIATHHELVSEGRQMAGDWTFGEVDEAIAGTLARVLPDAVFDAHAHLYRVSDLSVPVPDFAARGPASATLAEWRRHTEQQVGRGRCRGGLFFPIPSVDQAGADRAGVDRANDFLLEQLSSEPASRGLILIHPDDSPDEVADKLGDERIVGFKVYHTFSPDKPTFEAGIESFLPDWAWSLADDRGLIILLHLVKSRALADPDNQRYLRARCEAYPGAKLVLAHAARGFHAPHTVEGLGGLAGLTNVWFDTSAVCESAALVAIIERFGPRRLLWGSDFPVSQIRGKCVTVGDGFAWLQADTVQWDRLKPGCEPALVGLESLRAVGQAIDEVGLNGSDVRDIFFDNAMRLVGLEQEAGTATEDLYRHARERIPGGTQLLSKRPEMLAPGQWPAYFREARGCEVWDLDGRRFVDMSTNGIGSCLLGYRDPDVTRAVKRRVTLGAMSTLNPPEEVELADRLCRIHPWARQARFARTGGEAVAVAVRIARATTKRSRIAVCGYHGWHDWYLAANLSESDRLVGHLLPGLEPAGVPEALRGSTVTFTYNDPEAFESMLAEHGDQLAAVVMEPCRHHEPTPGFLERVRDGARAHGALLVFDEITIAWRLWFGGAHLKFGVTPDMAVFAKALGNGHPMAAIIGTEQAMAGAHESFISSTYWTESVGPVAALATLDKMQNANLPEHVARIGSQVRGYWREHGARHRLPIVVGDGLACLASFRFEHERCEPLRTLYTQLMLERGFLAGGVIYPTLAHDDGIVAGYGTAIDEVFGEIRGIIDGDRIDDRLKGAVAHAGFRRLT